MRAKLAYNLAVYGFALLICATASTVAFANGAGRFDGATPLEWSVRLADAEIARRGDSLAWRPGGRARWDYTAGLFTLSLLKLHEHVPNPRYFQFVQEAIGSFITPDGDIQTYRLDEYNIDHINPGKTVLALYRLTNEPRYKKAADLLRKQLSSHPRTSEGGFWHKQRYPYQMWLDGLYMGAPFYAEYIMLFGPAEDFDDVVKQFRLMDKAAYDPKTGLYYHGWDEKRQQPWANPRTGLSSNFWGRAVGWWVMAQVDVLDFLPESHPGRKEILGILNKTAKGIVRWQDKDTGVWWQVLDQPEREGNYREATASCMFVYALAKAVNRGYLTRDYIPAIVRGYEGIIKQFIRTNEQGAVSLTRCCSVAGLGFTTTVGGKTRPRDGSFEYYIFEAVVDNDLKGVGPFILAGIEMQKLLALPMKIEGNPALSKEGWALVPEILARIKPPVFPDRDFVITDYGAVGDGKTDCTKAIARAIEACHKAGGGRVVVPPGNYHTGPIRLLSNVNLHVAEGATLLFSTNTTDYLPPVLTRWEGLELYNYSPLIYAYGQENIAVTGKGTLDGRGEPWWPWKGRWKNRQDWANNPQQQKSARDRLIEQARNNVPVSQRVYGEGDYLRPNLFAPHSCRNVLVEGVRVLNSPMWHLNPVLCTNVIIRNVTIIGHGPNNDGCNPESCTDVLIEGCYFDTGDDCIAIKSGRNEDGRRIGIPSSNIVIRRCTMRDGHGGVVIGSEISGGCKNVFAEDCEMDSPNLDRVLRFKSNAVRGGVVENVYMRNVKVGQVARAVLEIDFLYEEGTNGMFMPVVRNVVMENISVQRTPRVLYVVGFPGAEIKNVRIYNSVFRQVEQDDVVKEADVQLINCRTERKQR
ncbi:MAG: glycoside hydrolase family 88 protein [Verrucomicrobiae bacterium]|nr:glycoside hydrolase family 88 protein [Verrucomicrobiae bacterium]